MSCLLSCCASSTCGLCTSVASGISGRSARLGYCGLFGFSLITSWIIREVGAPLLEKLPYSIEPIIELLKLFYRKIKLIPSKEENPMMVGYLGSA
ncbi:TMS membrane protein/tumor differentially expressed protein [Macleaya cordata]|uniref:TMS membrane protein/tumor differentially expressed protein n=1 Tax=Macleaya cordata TaxID=56857 RepID=A0A200RBH1_MACCD|nr:TMS membrane protein/tumor differentially expressed protein [Macleaya cordata]